MGHFAQYRHRGGGTTGFISAPPTGASWVAIPVALHVQVNPTNPGISGVVDAIAIIYFLATPNAIVESLVCPFGSGTSSVTAFIAGNMVGVRLAYRAAGGVITSPYSAEKPITF